MKYQEIAQKISTYVKSRYESIFIKNCINQYNVYYNFELYYKLCDYIIKKEYYLYNYEYSIIIENIMELF